jgi:GrpB-like predicted nucleotidyltransferase (UPF0157 family)
MSKPLSEMTLEELWQLFPIILTKHNDEWKDWYKEERENLEKILEPKSYSYIYHIGSTAIPGIWAKPTVDILIEIPKNYDMVKVCERLVECGYGCMSEEPERISLNKGYTEQGFAKRVFHIHLRYEGDHNEVYFRDYMIKHPDLAKQYEKLKLSLWKEFEHNRDGYTEAKGNFVNKYTELAKKEEGVVS